MTHTNSCNGLPEVISLIRFSTAEQVAEGRSGIARQRSANEAGAMLHGLKIRREMVVVDVSGRHVKDDPQFQALFGELQDPTLAGVIAPEQSRIFRPEEYGDYAILDHFSRNRKLIYTPSAKIDPTTAEGRMTLVMGGLMSGEELHKIRERCNSGKAIKRLQGGHPGGNQMLPKTVRFVRERNNDGKIIDTRWELVPLEADRMRRAFQLLAEGDSYELIAETVGGGWTGKGIRECLQNPVHIGIRRYEWEAKGPEYTPKATAKNPTPKKRRKLTKRAQPLDVPTREEIESGKAQPIVEPIVTLAQWDRAQAIIAGRMTRWSKSKLKNEGRERFVASGIGTCTCGQPLYGKYGSRGSHTDAYICQSRHKGGKGCGAPSVKRTELDAAVAECIGKLANAGFVLAALEAALALQEVPADPARIDREKALAKLETGRKEMLAMVRSGDMTRDEFKSEMAILEADVRALEALVPTVAPQVNPQQLAELVVSVFAEFAFLSFTQQRNVLRGALRSIIVDGSARAITTVTISGGYLGRGVNSVLPSRAQFQIDAIQDITIRLPHPVVIAATYVDGRTANGHHPATVATQYRAVA